MNPIREKLQSSSLLARAVPFVIFLAFTALQDSFGQAGRYWIYFAKTIAGIWLVAGLLRPLVAECRWVLSWEAVVVGVGVCVVWVGLDPYYPHASEFSRRVLYPLYRVIGLASWCQPEVAVVPWNPHSQFGAGGFLAWLFVMTRLLGSTFVVPPLEEVFYRSFVYRYISRVDFLAEPLGQFRVGAFFITAVVFGFSHQEWLAGILCAFAYQGLVCWKKRLGDAITAHAITNLLLGLWIITRGDWHFW